MERIKRGDFVFVTVGKDRGKSGKVLNILIKNAKSKAVVEGINMAKVSKKKTIIDKPMPLSSANIMLICKACKNPTCTKAGYEGEKKVRICKKCNSRT